MSTQEINQTFRDYLTGGWSSLAHRRGHPLVEAMIAGERDGRDLRFQIASAMEDLGCCVRLQRQSKAAKNTIAFRLIIVFSLVATLRFFFLILLSDLIWQDWVAIDRLCLVALVILVICGFYIYGRIQVTRGAERLSGTFIESWCCNFLTLSPHGDGSESMVSRLTAAKIGEIRTGVDSVSLRQQIYMESLAEHNMWLRDCLERWSMVGILIEILTFVALSAGLLSIPFVAWLESGSGGG